MMNSSRTLSRRIALTITTALLTALAAAGCGGQTTSVPESGEGAAVKALNVGAILSKSGGAAAYGEDADKGARLAVEQINATGGSLRVQYTALDDKSDRNEAVKAAHDLIDNERVQVILGPAISPSAISVGKLAEERQVPIVITSATQDEVTVSSEYDRRYVSRVCFDDSFQGRVLAKFAAESLGKKTAVIVFDKTLSYSIGLSKSFREAFVKLGGRIIAEENYSVSDTDFSALIEKVARYDAEMLFIPGWDENVGPMLNQARSKWDKFVLLGGDGWPTPKLLELAGGHIPQAFAVSHYAPEEPGSRVKAFREAFLTKYGAEPSPFAALGYDAMMLIRDAAGRAKTFDGPAMKDAINASRDIPLVTGTLTFDEHRNPIKDAIIVEIKPDGIAFRERVKP